MSNDTLKIKKTQILRDRIKMAQSIKKEDICREKELLNIGDVVTVYKKNDELKNVHIKMRVIDKSKHVFVCQRVKRGPQTIECFNYIDLIMGSVKREKKR